MAYKFIQLFRVVDRSIFGTYYDKIIIINDTNVDWIVRGASTIYDDAPTKFGMRRRYDGSYARRKWSNRDNDRTRIPVRFDHSFFFTGEDAYVQLGHKVKRECAPSERASRVRLCLACAINLEERDRCERPTRDLRKNFLCVTFAI